MKHLALFAAAFAILLLPPAVATSRADVIRQQQACNGACANLNPNGTTTVRSFTFNAPRRGTAIVSFNGTLYCNNTGMNVESPLFQSQIVENNAQPNPNGPSGLELQTTMEPGNSANQILTHNLASSRIFQINAPGTHTFQLRIDAFIGAGVSCAVRQGAFRVHLVERN